MTNFWPLDDNTDFTVPVTKKINYIYFSLKIKKLHCPFEFFRMKDVCPQSTDTVYKNFLNKANIVHSNLNGQGGSFAKLRFGLREQVHFKINVPVFIHFSCKRKVTRKVEVKNLKTLFYWTRGRIRSWAGQNGTTTPHRAWVLYVPVGMET